ncbi:hypothetical protein GCM10028790_48420 [Micromonospora taraxaci]
MVTTRTCSERRQVWCTRATNRATRPLTARQTSPPALGRRAAVLGEGVGGEVDTVRPGYPVPAL